MARKVVDPPREGGGSGDRDWGVDLSKIDERVKALEGRPAPWWQYAILGAVAVVVVFGGSLVEVIRGRIEDLTQRRR